MCPHVGWPTCQNVHMIGQKSILSMSSCIAPHIVFWYRISWWIWTRLLQLNVSGIYLSTLHPYASQGLLSNLAFDLDTRSINSDLHPCTIVNRQGISLAFILVINTYFFQYISNIHSRIWSIFSEEKWNSKFNVQFTL